MDAPAVDPAGLPIRAHAAAIAAAVQHHAAVVVIAETGSGKTTQIGQMLLDAGLAGGGVVAVTQPRRVAAVMVARRVAAERGTPLGGEVGYKVRFDDCSSAATRIKFMTDGALLREALDDPALGRYSVVIIDEAHERSLATDLLLGLLKQRLEADAEAEARGGGGGGADGRRRPPPLRVVVTSATLDGDKFAAYFGRGAPVLRVPGRAFPVEVRHALPGGDDDPDAPGFDYAGAAVAAALQVHAAEPPGGVLVFLTGRDECERAARALADAVRAAPAGSLPPMQPLALYASLPPEAQARAFAPPPAGARRVVVATTVAETSVTVEGVGYVVDAGRTKLKARSPATGLDTLAVAPASRVQAAQRAGRAGRTRAGVCLRTYTRRFFEEDMPEAAPPEVLRCDLASAVLYIKSLRLPGLDVLRFPFPDPPPRGALKDALRQLFVLEAIDGDGQVTALGRAMAALPLAPPLARALLAARARGCLGAALTAAAVLSLGGAAPAFAGGRGPGQLLAEHAAAARRRAAGGGGPPPRLTDDGAALLARVTAEGVGDAVALVRLYGEWEAAGSPGPGHAWCRGACVDARALRAARDVRRQLERVAGRGGEGLGAPDWDWDWDWDWDDPEEEAAGGGGGRAPKRRRDGGGGAAADTSASQPPRGARDLRAALAVGFGCRLARRLPRADGYRTLGGAAPALAAPHPGCAPLAAGDDGRLPEWLLYAEAVDAGGGRVHLSGVTAVEGAMVDGVLARLRRADAAALGGGGGGGGGGGAAAAAGHAAAGAAPAPAAPARRRNDGAAVEEARARYLARRAARGR